MSWCQGGRVIRRLIERKRGEGCSSTELFAPPEQFTRAPAGRSLKEPPKRQWLALPREVVGVNG